MTYILVFFGFHLNPAKALQAKVKYGRYTRRPGFACMFQEHGIHGAIDVYIHWSIGSPFTLAAQLPP